MAHSLYLIRQHGPAAQGVCLFEKHNAKDLTKFLNDHYNTQYTLDLLFKGSISQLKETSVTFKTDIVDSKETINEMIDHGMELMQSYFIIYKNGTWKAYMTKTFFKEDIQEIQ
jgi:hypothetical protein